MTERDRIRELIKEYADTVALTEKSREIEKRYKDLNALNIVRPPVLIFEIPWGEIRSDELKTQPGEYQGMEYGLRMALFQNKYFRGDHTWAPHWGVGVHVHNSGYGIGSKEKQIPSTTGAYIVAHEYEDQLINDEDVEKIKFPTITYDKEGTENSMNKMRELLGDILPVRKTGVVTGFASWDFLMSLHGIEKCYEDLYDRPEFIHARIRKTQRSRNGSLLSALHPCPLPRYASQRY